MYYLATRSRGGIDARNRSGWPSPSFVLGLLCPLTILCFVVGVALAVTSYPAPFDVRLQWISSLASAKRNPTGYFYMGGGLTAVAVLLLPLRTYLSGGVHASPVARSVGSTLLLIGIAALLLLGVETTAFPNYGRSRSIHRLLTVLTLTSLTLGFITLTISRVRTMPGRWGPAWLACGALLAPGLGTALTGLLLHLGHDHPGWAISRPARHAAPFFHTLSFWEWAAVTGLFAGGYLAAWAVTPRRAPVPARAAPQTVRGAAGRSPTLG
jgi:hypothetical protein